jgi:hypothetical protein
MPYDVGRQGLPRLLFRDRELLILSDTDITQLKDGPKAAGWSEKDVACPFSSVFTVFCQR